MVDGDLEVLSALVKLGVVSVRIGPIHGARLPEAGLVQALFEGLETLADTGCLVGFSFLLEALEFHLKAFALARGLGHGPFSLVRRRWRVIRSGVGGPGG